MRTKSVPPRRPSPAAAPCPWVVAARWVLVAHLVISPLAFARANLESFEFIKVELLQVTALVAGGLAVAAAVAAHGGSGWARRLAAAVREPVTGGALLLVLSAAVSTVFSINPMTSLRGVQESYTGLVTVASYLLLFLATRACCTTKADGW